jgi:MFS family permease
MLLFASYAGRLGDRIGHLLVMRILSGIGTVMIGGFVFLDSYAFMCGAVFIAGASLASISPVSLALQGVVSPPEDISRATAIYNAFYAVGMLIGPPISSFIFARISGAAMLYHLAALWVSFLLFAFIFQRDDPAATRRRGAVAVRELGA